MSHMRVCEKKVLRCRLKTGSDDDDVTSAGGVFHTYWWNLATFPWLSRMHGHGNCVMKIRTMLYVWGDVCRAHDRDEKKKCQSPDLTPDTSSADVHTARDNPQSRDNLLSCSNTASNMNDITRSTQLTGGHQMSVTTVLCCIPPACNVLSLPSYLVTPAWTTSR